MYRSILPILAGFAGPLISVPPTLAVATPPKKPAQGTAIPGQSATGKGASDQSIRHGHLTPREWFGFVARIKVSVTQQNELTPLIRNYLAEFAKWSRDGAVRMRTLMEEVKTSDDARRKLLRERIRELRRSMPRYDRVKREVSELLTPAQRARLSEMMQERRSSLKKPSAFAAGEKPEERRGPAGGEPVDSPANRDEGRRDSTPKLWSFQNDLDPGRHTSPKEASASPGDASSSVEGADSEPVSE